GDADRVPTRPDPQPALPLAPLSRRACPTPCPAHTTCPVAAPRPRRQGCRRRRCLRPPSEWQCRRCKPPTTFPTPAPAWCERLRCQAPPPLRVWLCPRPTPLWADRAADLSWYAP